MEILRQNLEIASKFQPMTTDEMRKLRDRVKVHAGDGHFELYKTSIKYDNPQARLTHDFPLDPNANEVQEMMSAAKNSGKSIMTIPPPAK